jgi:PEGA domain
MQKNRYGVLMVAVALMAAPGAWARKLLLVGVGNCRDPALISAARDFQEVARPMLKKELFVDEDVLAIVRNPPLKSIEDVQRQVDAAKTLLYGGQNERGLDLIRQALTELDRASPKVKPWNTQVSAWMIESQLLKNLERGKESADSYRRILRLEPFFRLDADNFPPSTLQSFETIRKDASKIKKAVLQVQSNVSSMVLLDGKEVGRTPLKIEVQLGTYRLQLLNVDSVSFPRRVTVQRDEFVQIDMQYEGALSEQSPLCLNRSDDASALKLGQSVSADEVIVVRNDAQPGNPTYIRGTIYDVGGKQMRDGGASIGLLKNLVTFLVTGQPQAGIDSSVDGAKLVPKNDPKIKTPQIPPPEKPKDAASVKAEPVELLLKPKAIAAPIVPSEIAVAPATRLSLPQIVSLSVMGLGVATAGAGIAFAVVNQKSQYDLDKGTLVTGLLDTTLQGAGGTGLLQVTHENRIVAGTIIGTGAGLAAAGLLGFFLFPSEPVLDGANATLSAAFGPTGGNVSVSGRF